MGLMSSLAFHGTYINCTVFAKRQVLENGFHQRDSAASPRFHEICEQGILYTKHAAAAKEESTPRPNALHPNIRYQNQNCRVQLACALTKSQNRTQRANRERKTNGKHNASTL